MSQACGTTAPATARHFTFEDMGSYRRVNSTRCSQSYILYNRGTPQPALGSSYKYFAVPLTNVAVTETVTNTFLETLGVRDAISVASNYTTSSCIKRKIEDGQAQMFVSHSSNPTAHAVQMGNAQVEAIFSSPYGTNNWNHAASASKIICEASTYELDPRGSAEWIKFFGYLFGKNTEAQAAYCGTNSRYSCGSIVAQNNNLGSTRVPKVAFTSRSWNGAYSIQVLAHAHLPTLSPPRSPSPAHVCQMPPYKDQFVHDAGAVYPDLSHFDNFRVGTGPHGEASAFNFPAANVSQFHEALNLADILIDETYPHGQNLTSIASQYSLPGITIGQTFLVGGDDPASGSTGWALVSHGVGEKLFTVDGDGQVVPRLAHSVVRQPDGSWLLTLAAGRKFSDGSPVTATDVAASIGRTNRLNSAAQSSLGTMTLTVRTELTLTIASTRATPVMDAVLAEWAFVVYKTVGNRRIFTGPYAIQTDVSTTFTSLQLAPNTEYPGYEQRMPITIRRFPNGVAVARALVADEIDMGFNLPANSVPQLNWVDGLSVRSFPVDYQYMMFYNTARPALSDVRVRRAISLALDRTALSRACSAPGMSDSAIEAAVATGAFASNTAWGSAHPRLPTDATEAARLLDEAGWVLGSDGVRVRNGQRLTLDLVYYTFRSDLVVMAPLVQAQLRALGVQATARVNDVGDFMEGQSFDMLMWAQNTLPAGDPNWFLETFFRTGPVITGNWRAQNFAQLSSTAIDGALDVLATAEGAARVTAAANAHRTIIAEHPATFLTSPTWHVGLGSRMSSYEPWGSDYYVIKQNMPASDWPPAFVNGRLYTLDGTMDSRGPPRGGTDWYESRVAEPDTFLADLIAVAHPATPGNFNPSGMHFLRHARDGTTTTITSAQCTNPSATHSTHAPTCAALASAATDAGIVARLNAEISNAQPIVPSPTVPAVSPSAPVVVVVSAPASPPTVEESPSPSSPAAVLDPSVSALSNDGADVNVGLYAAIGVLAAALVFTIISVVIWRSTMQSKSTGASGKKYADATSVQVEVDQAANKI